MARGPTPIQTLADRVAALQFDQHVLKAGFFGDDAWFVLTDGTIEIGRGRPALRPHADAILVAAGDANRIVTGGDDGKVIETRPDGATAVLADERGRWIDALALGPDDSVAWSTGRTARARDGKGRVRELPLPSTSQGLAFGPKGYRLAIAHVDGATLWMPNAEIKPDKFSWKGPHLDVTVSPDNRFIVTSMQENQLHGWRIVDFGHMRMSGYPGKTRAFSWSHDGLWLATSGAEGAIVWPFAKDGPTGKAPRECGIRPARVSQVAFHPRALVLAIGYQDGWVMLCRLTDASELLVRAGGDGAAITALAWDREGKQLAFGGANGASGLLSLPV